MSNKENYKTMKIIRWLSFSLSLLILICSVLFYVFKEKGKGESEIPKEDKNVSSNVTDSKDNSNTIPPETEKSNEHTITQPTELTDFLKSNKSSYKDLSNLNCKQLVVVSSQASLATIKFYEYNDERWREIAGLDCSGYVGVEGVIDNFSEDRSGTPKGLYSIGSAFYINESPKTKLDSFKITKDTYWIDDPDSAYYNKKVEGTENKDWKSAEHMIDYQFNYEYGFVINYNMEAKYNAGSAIFFHIGARTTVGCVATSKDMVLAYLEKLDKSTNPHILII